MLLYLILGAVILFFAVILLRAAMFRPAAEAPVKEVPVSLDREKIVRDMADMVCCKTVSNRDHALEDPEEFEKFRQLLKERYPNVHKACTLEHIGRNGLLYSMKGASSAAPTVLMAHYDVVPAEEALWSKPAFAGIVEDGIIWGRGTLDTKGTLLGVMESLETVLREGYVPKNDLYLSFSGEEEVDGSSCAAIVSTLEERGITPALVLDEGGAVVEKVFPGVTRECALVGIAEKGGVNLDLTLDSEGGHASTPPKVSTLGKLSRAIVRIEKHPFPCQLTKPVKEMFDTLGRHSNFLFRVIFANLWCFLPVLDLICRLSGGELNALMRTTTAITRMEGSKAYNVLPPKASVGINMRLLGSDNMESVKAYLRKVIKNDKIRIDIVSGMNPSISSDTACGAWETVKEAIRETWPEAIVSPYLMMACSDSRHYCRITDKVYRFCPMRLSKEERGMIHGHDERVPVETLLSTVAFYVRLLKKI